MLVTVNGSYQKIVTLANAVTISDTAQKTYNLITDGSLAEEQIRQYKRFKVSLNNSHDQAATVSLYTANRGFSSTTAPSSSLLYTESGVLTASSGRLILQDKSGGTGAVQQLKAIPALEGLHSNLFVVVQFAVAPTSGSITIVVEMVG